MTKSFDRLIPNGSHGVGMPEQQGCDSIQETIVLTTYLSVTNVCVTPFMFYADMMKVHDFLSLTLLLTSLSCP